MDKREMFARLIRCESEDQGENGMKAVATCVMNRTRSITGEYWRICRGNLAKVMGQSCQFACYKEKILGIKNKRSLWDKSPEAIHYKIADSAMHGNVFSGIGTEVLWFMDPHKKTCPSYFPYDGAGKYKKKIVSHCFYNLTSKYRNT